MCKYAMDPASIFEDTERTRFCPQTDRQMEGRTDKVKPVYPPSTLFSGGYKNDPVVKGIRHCIFLTCRTLSIGLTLCQVDPRMSTITEKPSSFTSSLKQEQKSNHLFHVSLFVSWCFLHSVWFGLVWIITNYVVWSHCNIINFQNTITYHKISNMRCTESQNLNVSRLVLQLSLHNLLKPGVKSRMKMQLEQRRHIYIYSVITDSSNGLLPVWHNYLTMITWANADLLLIGR